MFSSLQASIGALVVAIGNAAIAFSVIGNETATRIESATVGVIAAVFVIVNEVKGNTLAKSGRSSEVR